MPLLPNLPVLGASWDLAQSIIPVHTITPSSQPVIRTILSCLLHLISTHQHQSCSLLALSPSHQSYASLILCWQLSLSSCVLLLKASLSTPLLWPTNSHCSPSHRVADPQDPQLPQSGCPPAPAALRMHLEEKSSKRPHCPGELA